MIKVDKYRLFPFLQWWPKVNSQTLKSDLVAGLTGAIIVLPQGVAFALIAGLPPVYGMYTAMITPIIAALFGSSYHLISGPTTALSLAIFSSVSLYAQPSSENFIVLTLLLTFLTGVIQFVLGVARMGTLVNFVSHSVIIGFTLGAAILIATSQLKHVLGLHIAGGTTFIETWNYLIHHFREINPYAAAIGLGTLLIAVMIKKFYPAMPNLLIALLTGTITVYYLSDAEWNISLVGAMPRGLPPFKVPHFNFESIAQLTPNALAIALLGLIEAIAIARGIAVKTHQRLNSNQEFIGQGLSNIIGSFFSCYVGSGSFTRSGVNYTAGAKTPMAAIFAALILIVIMLAIAPLAAHLPMPTMGGIILLVAYNLVDVHHLKQIFRTSRSETIILLITFFCTLFINIEFAIFAGIIFSLAFYLMRTSRPKVMVLAPTLLKGERKFINVELHQELSQCPQFHIIRIDGSLFFGAVDHIKNVLYDLSETKKHILIVGTGINFIDASGADLLTTEAERMKSLGGGLYFSHMKKSVSEYLNKGYKDKIGVDQFFLHKEDAIAAIYDHLDKSICESCEFKIFRECVKN